MTYWQLIALAFIFAVLYSANVAWNDYLLVRAGQVKSEWMLAMSREETKRWEILTGIIVNQPASRYPFAPPNPHRKQKDEI